MLSSGLVENLVLASKYANSEDCTAQRFRCNTVPLGCNVTLVVSVVGKSDWCSVVVCTWLAYYEVECFQYERRSNV